MKAKKDRKSKGTFSVIGEFFSDSGLGDIVYDPKLPPEQAAWIEKATHLADVPLSRRAEAEKDYDTKKQFLAEDTFVGKSTKKSNYETITKHKAKQLRNNYETNFQALKNEKTNESDDLQNNPTSITKQLRNNYETQSETITKQLQSNYETNEESAQQLGNYETITKHKAKQLRNNYETNVTSSTSRVFNFLKISGHRKKIIESIFDLCQKSGSLSSGPISKEFFETLTGIDGDVIRVTCSRLKKEGALSVGSSRRGRGGFLEYEMHPSLYAQILSIKTDGITKQLRNNYETQSETQSETNLSRQTDRLFFEMDQDATPSAREPLLKKEPKKNLSTLSERIEFQSSWNFADLDFSPIDPINLSFVNVAIRKEAEAALTQDQVQDFINRFASYLSHQNTKKILNSCGLFCGELKKLINPTKNGRTQVLDFEIEAERKVNAEMAQKILKIQMENELVEKARGLSSDKEKFESEKEIWIQQVREMSQTLKMSDEIIYITAFGNWKEAQQK